MGKAADDTGWLDELAQARESEGTDDSPHPADGSVEEVEAEQRQDPDQRAQADQPAVATDAQDKADDRSVPLSVLTEERNKLQARLSQQDQTIQQLNSKLEKLSKIDEDIRALREARDKPAPAPAPDYLDDPKGYVDHTAATTVEKLRSIEDAVNKTTEEITNTRSQLNQQQQVQAIQALAAQHEEQFAGQRADYWDALNHLRQVRQQQLSMAFPDASPQQIEQHIRGEEFQTAAQLLQQGRSPAEYAYNFAKTLGYTPKQSNQDNSQSQEDAHLKRENAQGLGSGGGGGSELDTLLDLPKDEFDQAMAEVFGQ